MPPCDRAVDSISPALDKHDSARGKVDRGDLAAGQWDASRAISVSQGARQFRPLRPAEPLAVYDLRYRASIGRPKLAHGVRKVTKMLDNSGRNLLEKREQLVANAGAQKPRVPVGWIVRVGDAVPFDVRRDVGAPGAHERPNELRRSRGKPPEPGGSGPPDEANQHRLSAIVGVVPGRDEAMLGADAIAALLASSSERFVERMVPSLTRAGHQVRSRSDLDIRRGERHAELLRESARERELVGGGGAQAVVHAVGGDTHAKTRGKLRHHVEQGHRIGAAGDGHEYEGPRLEEALVDDRAFGEIRERWRGR